MLGNTGAVACYRLSPSDAVAVDGLYPTISVRRLQTLPKHTLALTRFEDDLVLPGPVPLEGHEDPADVAAQLRELGLPEDHPSGHQPDAAGPGRAPGRPTRGDQGRRPNPRRKP